MSGASFKFKGDIWHFVMGNEEPRQVAAVVVGSSKGETGFRSSAFPANQSVEKDSKFFVFALEDALMFYKKSTR